MEHVAQQHARRFAGLPTIKARSKEYEIAALVRVMPSSMAVREPFSAFRHAPFTFDDDFVFEAVGAMSPSEVIIEHPEGRTLIIQGGNMVPINLAVTQHR